MRIENNTLAASKQKSSFESVASDEVAKNKPAGFCGTMPGKPDGETSRPEAFAGGPGGIGDMGFATTLAIGEEDGGGSPIPVEPDGGIGDGAGPIPIDAGGPIPVEPDGGIGDGAGPIPIDAGGPIPVEPDGGIGDGAGPIPVDPDGPFPVEPDGGIGDGAGPIPIDAGGPDVTTLALGEEDGGGGGPIPVEPDGGIGDGAGPIPVDPDGPVFTTLAIGEEDGGGSLPPAPAPIGGNITGTKGDDVLTGSDGDDVIRGRAGDDAISTGQGNDVVRGGRGDDTITVTGIGDKKINGGKGNDTLELKGLRSDYAIQDRSNSTVYTSQDGSRITVRNVETVNFSGGIEPPVDPEFQANYSLAPNDLGATSLDINGDTAVLSGPDTNFTFTGVDPSGFAFDGPLIATGGSGTINGEETTAVPLSQFGPAVLTIGSGFNPTGTQGVSAAFANGVTLDTTVGPPPRPLPAQ